MPKLYLHSQIGFVIELKADWSVSLKEQEEVKRQVENALTVTAKEFGSMG